MGSHPCATTSPSRSPVPSKYAALLSGLERSCSVASAMGSCPTPHTEESKERCCVAPPPYLDECPGSFLALSSSVLTNSYSVSSSFASYSPLVAQRRSEAASAAARSPSALFEVRVHRRRGKGIHSSTRQDCEAFTQNVDCGRLRAPPPVPFSLDTPSVATHMHGPHSYSTCAAAALRPGDAQHPRGSGSDTHEVGVATPFSLTADDYLSHYLAHYSDRFLSKLPCLNATTTPSVTPGDGLDKSALMPGSKWSDFSETLVSIRSSSVCSCAALPAIANIPGCSPIVEPDDVERVEGGDYSDETRISSRGAACRLFFSPSSSLSHS